MNNWYKKFRGNPELIRKRLSSYVAYFRNCHKVLDLGCGRGEFLGLLKNAGIKAIGVDGDAQEIEICRQAGYEVMQSDIFEYLSANSGFDGIMASHVIEHMDCKSAENLVSSCYNVLTSGGVMAIITPNSENLEAMTKTFWLDPTHIRPYPQEYLVELLKGTGFEIVAAGDDPVTRPIGGRAALGRNLAGPVLHLFGMDRLRHAVFCGHDVFAIGRKP